MKQICSNLINSLAENITLDSVELNVHYKYFLDAVKFCRDNQVEVNRDLLKSYGDKIFYVALCQKTEIAAQIIVSFDKDFDYYTEPNILALCYDNWKKTNEVFQNSEPFYVLGDYLVEKFKDFANIEIMFLANSLSSPTVHLTHNIDSQQFLEHICKDDTETDITITIATMDKILSNIILDKNLVDFLTIYYKSHIIECDDDFRQEAKQFIDKIQSTLERQTLDSEITDIPYKKYKPL